MTDYSTDARQLFADQHIDNAFASERGEHRDPASLSFTDRPDHTGAAAEWVRTQGGKCLIGVFRRRNYDDFAFVGQIEGVEAQYFAEAPNILADRSPGLLDFDRNLRGIRDLVEDRRQPPRVASRKQRMPGAATSSFSMRSCSAAQSLSIAASRAMSPRAVRTAAP
jgi:hypothetical protein